MARNDGIDRTSARNVDVPDKDIDNTQKHNEREKDSYRNPDIIPERLSYNVHFKNPAASYTELFAQMESSGMISTRGLKPDAIHYGELIFDVNSAYFHNHGGYEFAKQFYAEAYQAAVKIVGGEQYILSAVMHADEINRAMSEALGQDVYHYHLMWCMSQWWKSRFSGQSGARIRLWWGRSRRPLCRSAAAKSGCPNGIGRNRESRFAEKWKAGSKEILLHFAG